MLDMVIHVLPSPIQAQKLRLNSIWKMNNLSEELQSALLACDKNYHQVIMHIPKMVMMDYHEVKNALLGTHHTQTYQRQPYQRGKYIVSFGL